ncbi:hypothetical protein RhiirA1_538840 [Rhizophagus irregularis]|uniref:Uncharacterized protein n=1 Tax=Rhizophagus irregularis TaxID=588596 RepID=A0A2N0RF85_9GLOM|nr:hypothetical protein RhiirA1_538840 [Rhizophagus irregularis]
MMNLKSMKKKLVEEGISGFRWFFQVTLEDILVVLSVYISCDGQVFGCVKFPTTGQAFGHVKFSTVLRFNTFFQMSRPFDMFCKVSNSGIGYWNLEMKGFDWVPGDWRRSRRTNCFGVLGLFCFKEKFHFFGLFQIAFSKTCLLNNFIFIYFYTFI